MYFHPDFPFYFSSAISMLQPQAEHHLTKGGLRGTQHDESGFIIDQECGFAHSGITFTFFHTT